MTPVQVSRPAQQTAGRFPPEIQRMLATARSTIDRHLGDHGRCIECGDPWPCTQAQLADTALSGL